MVFTTRKYGVFVTHTHIVESDVTMRVLCLAQRGSEFSPNGSRV